MIPEMQRTSPTADVITVILFFTFYHLLTSVSSLYLPLSFSCNTPRNLPAACQTCRFAARCRTSIPRRWAERWRWHRRPWTRPRRGPEPHSHTTPGKHAANNTKGQWEVRLWHVVICGLWSHFYFVMNPSTYFAMRGNLNAAANKHILDNTTLATLCQQFVSFNITMPPCTKPAP